MVGKVIINKKFFVLPVIFLVFIFFLLFFLKMENNFSKNQNSGQIQYVKIAGKKIKVDLALTAETREKGLSGRNFLEEGKGMLFVFNQADKYSFWMKDMKFPIDIIWIGEDFRVVYMKENALPESYPETFTPGQNARYVLEVSAGFLQKENLKLGDKAEFSSS